MRPKRKYVYYTTVLEAGTNRRIRVGRQRLTPEQAEERNRMIKSDPHFNQTIRLVRARA